MGLATPAAIMAGANAAARRGILIRDGIALEKAGKITAVIFDKTGTLTIGRPEVSAEQEFGMQNLELRILAAALARNSNHPISQAITKVSKMSSEVVKFESWNELRGCGIEASLPEGFSLSSPKGGEGRGEEASVKFSSKPSYLGETTGKIAGKIVRLGSLDWLRENGVDLTAGGKFISEWSTQGATIVGLATEKNLLGLFAVRDTLKTNAAKIIAQLHRQKLKSYLVTGDNSTTAASIARQAGIAVENVFAGARPEQKAEFVKKLQARGERVAFVGDGINDAPALTQADLGIAVSRASDLARGAADIILLKSEIEAVPECLALTRATLRIIKQNLFWAFFYNALGVPLAALGFISPVFCAVAMGVSDLIVIGNALRLLRK
jgi:Cu+-exporting ATPase